MPDDPEIWEPSDEWLASLVRHLRGMVPGTHVPPGLLAAWRRLLRIELRRHATARSEGRKPTPLGRDEGDRAISSDDVIRDLLASPDGQFLLGVAGSMPAILARLAADATVSAWHAAHEARRDRRAEAAAARTYLDWKLAARPHAYLADPPAAVLRAAVNGCTVARARRWLARLGEIGDPVEVLSEMRELGTAASAAAAPLRLWDIEPGPPRGIWPDPPPPAPTEEEGEGEAAVVAGQRPPFIPGKK